MLTIGSEFDFHIARDFLRENYSEAMLAAELGVPSVAEFLQREMGRPLRNTLARLFFGGVAIAPADLEAAIPEEARHALCALGLLEQNGAGGFVCPVLLYPVYGLLLVSDRMAGADGMKNPASVPKDFVYLALTTPTKTFLRMLPETECDALLDVGAGSGIAALIASRYAKQCWATDIAERSTLFAEFNVCLNGIHNVYAVQGSLYEPVEGHTFDRIVCHPPYDPSLTSSWTFCDGGYDGEFVLRGVIEGLGRHLRPGGHFFSQARGGDRKGQSLEQRIREWLGDAHRDFNIALVVRDIVQPQEFAIGSVMTTSRRMEDYEEYLRRFREVELEQLAYCNIYIERKTDTSEPLTLRRNLGVQCTPAELSWLMTSQRTTPHLNLQQCMPVMTSGFELVVRHGFRDGQLTPLSYVLDVAAPFREQVQCPPWIARLVAACDGAHTMQQLFDHLRENESMTFEQFEAALKRLIVIGVVAPNAKGAGA
jgi:SAM-dependent methyltransferase